MKNLNISRRVNGYRHQTRSQFDSIAPNEQMCFRISGLLLMGATTRNNEIVLGFRKTLHSEVISKTYE